jgi:alkylhydroperoxidase/carboxymuconolactone decarboxylase family protein YurZ
VSDTPEDEADQLAQIDEIRARLADLPNAMATAAKLNEGIAEASGLDLRTLFLVRIAAMAATGMPKIGWEVNLELMDGEVTADELEGVLIAVAPIIGTSKYLEAVSVLLADD